ncbi:MAG: calcium-binding protein [Cyanobacteria bacterium P01_A01_bin.40]
MIINGTAQDDNLVGTTGNDSITGAGGDDSINGGSGDDTLLGGIGDDLIRFNAGQKVVDGGPGDDFLFLNFINESEDFILTYNNQLEATSTTTGGILDGTEITGIERIIVTSGSGDDLIDIAVTSTGGRITSGAGDDLLIGGSGDDRLQGESGDDTFFGGPGNDEITGGAGNDASVYFGLSTDYEVVIDEAGAVTVTGVALENFEAGADLSEAEIFTDTLTDVEIVLFNDGEIIVETGEFIAFPLEEADLPVY